MRTKYILLTILSSLVFASCNYLDFDETNNLKTKEDMYKYFGTSKSMLTHVYSYMPQGYQLFATSGGIFTEDRYSMRDCASDDGEFGAMQIISRIPITVTGRLLKLMTIHGPCIAVYVLPTAL
mgnify:CR=1 FL=1